MVPTVRLNPVGIVPATGERECAVQPVQIDCDTCSVRGPACGDCMVSVLLGLPGHRSATPGSRPQRRPAVVRTRPVRVELEGELVGGAPLPPDLDDEERRALSVLADAGLVANLRVVRVAAARRAS